MSVASPRRQKLSQPRSLFCLHNSKPMNVELRNSPQPPKISRSRSLGLSSSRFESRFSSSFHAIAKLLLTRSLRVPADRLTMSYKRRRRTSSSKLAALKLLLRSLPPRRPQKRTS